MLFQHDDYDRTQCGVRCNSIYYTAEVSVGEKVIDQDIYFKDVHGRAVWTKNMEVYSYITDTKVHNVMNLVSLDRNQSLIEVGLFLLSPTSVRICMQIFPLSPEAPGKGGSCEIELCQGLRSGEVLRTSPQRVIRSSFCPSETDQGCQGHIQ